MKNSIQVRDDSIFINGENLWDEDLKRFSVDELRGFKELATKIENPELADYMRAVIAMRSHQGSVA